MQLELTQAERDELLKILEDYAGNTRVEARRTRTPDVHDALVEEGTLLRAIIEKLKNLG